MSWVSSTFDFDIKPNLKKKKTKQDFSHQASKKQCVNLWVDEYPPKLEDLAVHKKKIQELQSWLVECRKKVKERRILLLTGPPGCAKSTAIHALAPEMNFSLREWTNSTSSKQESFFDDSLFHEREQYVSQADRFSDFIFRSSKYKNICLNKAVSSSLILIEELPNVFARSPFEFQLILRKYFTSCTTPIVFIMSESNKGSLLKTLFPSEFQEELFITNIAFNPVSASLLLNALTRILNLTGNSASSFFDSNSASKKQFLQMIAERSGGDVRSAVNSLQFTMMRGDDRLTSSKKGKSKKGAKGKLESTDNFIGCKDTNLVLFRALGKILYCKRETSLETSALPFHLLQHARNPPLENPEEVFGQCDLNTSTFSLFLHHNCIPFFGDINEYSAAIQYLGDSDIFDAIWDPSDRLQQYSSSVSLRGMMHSLNGGQKGTHTFRSLTRPNFYNYVNTTKDREQRMRNVMKSCTMTREELFSVYVPLISKAVNASSTEADRFINEVGLFYPPLGNKTAKVINTILVTNEVVSEGPEEDDEEFCIEDYSD